MAVKSGAESNFIRRSALHGAQKGKGASLEAQVNIAKAKKDHRTKESAAANSGKQPSPGPVSPPVIMGTHASNNKGAQPNVNRTANVLYESAGNVLGNSRKPPTEADYATINEVRGGPVVSTSVRPEPKMDTHPTYIKDSAASGGDSATSGGDSAVTQDTHYNTATGVNGSTYTDENGRKRTDF